MPEADGIEWDEATFNAALKRVAAEGVIDAGGVRLSAEQLRRLLDEAPGDPEHPDRFLLREVDFRRATFEGDTGFFGASFSGNAAFDGARFSGVAGFDGARFSGRAGFAEARFSDAAAFRRARFTDATFQGASFSGDADFFGASFSGNAAFDWATFEGGTAFEYAVFDYGAKGGGFPAQFNHAKFNGVVRFNHAVLRHGAGFIEANFRDIVGLDRATFGGDANFELAQFGADTWLPSVTFAHRAFFKEARFKGSAHFDKATFTGEAHFPQATFEGDAHFPDATFERDAHFSDAIFAHDVHFDRATFAQDARFHKGSLKEAFSLGPLLVLGSLQLDGASFSGIEIRVSAERLSCSRTQFHGPANLRIRYAEVALDGAGFEGASVLAPSEALNTLPAVDEEELGKLEALKKREESDLAPRCAGRLGVPSDQERERRRKVGRTKKPRLVSLRGADVANLVVSELDLRACLFDGAHNVDRLRAERCDFAETPWRQWRWRKLWPFPWRWTRRETLAEEQRWRAEQKRSYRQFPLRKPHPQAARTRRSRWTDWYGAECQSPPWLLAPEALPPDDTAAIYRALRKGREDSRNEPGAANFYYSEMEMRRHAAKGRRRFRRIPGIEEAVLWLYWLVAGYGLRASRALVALAITIAVGAVLLSLSGFDAGKSPDDGTVLFAGESSISLLRAPDTKNLTAAGHVVQIALRIAGPLFFGLALLSLRGRVKR